MNSSNATPNFDNLLLQSLMGRLQIRPPNNPSLPPSLLNQTLEDLLFDATSANLSDSEKSDDDSGTELSKEESKLEKELIRTILSGKTESLKPNSGQAVSIGEHHICVGYHEEEGSDYRVWEWHGHLMLFDVENGYHPEYIYGNYFERLVVKPIFTKATDDANAVEEEEEDRNNNEKEDKVGTLGLRDLIDSGNSVGARVLHRSINASSPRLT